MCVIYGVMKNMKEQGGILCIIFIMCSTFLIMPVLAADEGQIAFQSNRYGSDDILIMNESGAGLLRLTTNPAFEGWPSLTKDGKRIAFARNYEGNLDICRINADGTGFTRLTNSPYSESQPAWSPDGKKIAYTTWVRGNSEIYVMNADGSMKTRITHSKAGDITPAWSPDGKKIAFSSNRNGLFYQVHVMDADGTNVTRLTSGPVPMDNWRPAYNPKGSVISYASAFLSSSQLVLMNADGTEQMEIPDTRHAYAAAWSPNGTRIAFYSDYYGLTYQVYTAGRNGSGRIALTSTPFDDNRHPTWSRVPGTLTIRGPGSAVLGSVTTVLGNNSFSKKTYLYLIGPNLSPDGYFLGVSEVDANNHWTFAWNTAQTPGVSIIAGTYSVYAFAEPVDLSKMTQYEYAMYSIVLKK
jgi:Tol biopolymer transport system component